MKKLTVTILLVALFIGAWVGASYYEHNYTRTDCFVTDKNDAVIAFRDTCGFTWVWCAETDEEIELYRSLKVGSKIDVKMFDNLTPHCIDDDEIKEIKIAK
jgi:hypothetical protein